MAEARTESGKYVTAADLLVGTALTLQGTNYKEIVTATAIGNKPLGIAAQPGKQNDNVGYLLPGQTVKAIASAAIAIGALVSVTTAGKMVTVVKALNSATEEWAWGYAVSSAAADLDIFEMMFDPILGDFT